MPGGLRHTPAEDPNRPALVAIKADNVWSDSGCTGKLARAAGDELAVQVCPSGGEPEAVDAGIAGVSGACIDCDPLVTGAATPLAHISDLFAERSWDQAQQPACQSAFGWQADFSRYFLPVQPGKICRPAGSTRQLVPVRRAMADVPPDLVRPSGVAIAVGR